MEATDTGEQIGESRSFRRWHSYPLGAFRGLTVSLPRDDSLSRAAEAGWVSTQNGKHLRSRVKSGTAPEMILRRAMHAHGLRFRVDVLLARGFRPDVALPGRRIAIFVDGCFWHGCPRHGRTSFRGPNSALWLAKLERNRRNDARAGEIASALGWEVRRFWECDIAGGANEIAEAISRLAFDNQIAKSPASR